MLAPVTLAPITAQALSDLPGVRHGFFTREGGISSGLYSSLNCGFGSNDQTAHVRENRARVARHLGSRSESVLTVHQVHSNIAVFVDEDIARADLPKADAAVTTKPGLVIGVLAADCAPVLFADAEARVIGAAHAGWRGATGGILEATIAAMVKAGARRASIRAAVGPCISQASYEVGTDFEAELVSRDPANTGFFARMGANPRPHFDLPAYVTARLTAAGIAPVERQTPCTYLEEQRFFSFRRTTHRKLSDYGRQIAAIVLN